MLSNMCADLAAGAAYSKGIEMGIPRSRVRREFLLAPHYWAFFAYTASAEILRSKQRMVIVSAEFGGKQSHEIGL